MWQIHEYSVCVEWTGNLGTGTSGYRTYSRNHDVRGTTADLPVIHGSQILRSEGTLTGGTRNSFCSPHSRSATCCGTSTSQQTRGVTVTAYSDTPTGIMVEHPGGTGEFTSATLRPTVTIAPGNDPERAAALHDRAAEHCFIARSVNFPVHHEAVITTEQ